MQNNLLFQQLSSEQEDLTSNLRQKIIAVIQASSTHAIPVSRYIELALYDNEYGYYNNLLHKFGRQGDFITAPMVSDLFAKSIAKQLSELWQHGTLSRNILEIGAGNGQLMLDLLPTIAAQIEHYYIVEISTTLAMLQQQRLADTLPNLVDKVIWIPVLPSKFTGVILANEVLDAQPCEVVVWEHGDIKLRNVSVDSHDTLCYVDSKITMRELGNVVNRLPVNKSSDKYVSEVNLCNRTLIKQLADSLSSGYILLIDYGYTMAEYYATERKAGTLRGFFQHVQIDDILRYPGLVDITASVDFSSVATTALENDLMVLAYITQGNFLLNCGILDIVASEQENTASSAYYKRAKEVQQLTLANEMGDIFKVMVLAKNVQFDDLMGMSHNNRIHTL